MASGIDGVGRLVVGSLVAFERVRSEAVAARGTTRPTTTYRSATWACKVAGTRTGTPAPWWEATAGRTRSTGSVSSCGTCDGSIAMSISLAVWSDVGLPCSSTGKRSAKRLVNSLLLSCGA